MSNNMKVQEIMDEIGKEFAIRKLGDLNFFLGIQVKRNALICH